MGAGRRTALAMALALAAASAAQAQQRTGIKDGFALRPGTARIVLMRPSIRAGSQSTGGLFEPNADWTDQARQNVGRALAEAQAQLGNAVVDAPEPVGDAAQRTAEYRALFSTVADQVITFQFFPGNRLPTKKRRGSFVWNVGPEVASLPGLQGADYALFVTTDDQFGSTGRKMLQVAALLARVPVQSGVHKGYAGLVDLHSGDLVWLNADQQMGGDVRTPEGARKRVAELFEGFPGRPSTPAAPASDAAVH